MMLPAFFYVRNLIYPSIVIFSLSSAASEPTLTINESLVRFSSSTFPETTKECQGVRVAKHVIATTAKCAKMISVQNSKAAVDVYGTHNQLYGKITRFSFGTEEEKPSLGVSIDGISLLRFDSSQNDEFNFYTTAYDSETESPVSTQAYFIGEQQLNQKVVTVSAFTPSGDLGYFKLSSNTQLPDGTPILDQDGKLVCLASSDSYCFLLPKGEFFQKLDYDDDDDTDTDLMTYLIAIPIVIVLLTGVMFAILACKAKHKGMPCGVLCKGMLCTYDYCQYFSWFRCFMFGWCAAVGEAGWKWIDTYDPSNAAESKPIINTQPQI
ncbi:hypothetical protein [Endozoicomonas sp. 2B-B]